MCLRKREREDCVYTRCPNRMPLTRNAGTARPSEGVQPRKKGAHLAQHARTMAGDIIELAGAHSQSLHTVEHGKPPSLSRNYPEPSVLPASWFHANVTWPGCDNNKLQQQLAESAAYTYLSLSLSLSALLSCRCWSFSFPPLSWNADLVPAWLSWAWLLTLSSLPLHLGKLLSVCCNRPK